MVDLADAKICRPGKSQVMIELRVVSPVTISPMSIIAVDKLDVTPPLFANADYLRVNRLGTGICARFYRTC
jgi:hypothetical protein